jgi:hypothetical protein
MVLNHAIGVRFSVAVPAKCLTFLVGLFAAKENLIIEICVFDNFVVNYKQQFKWPKLVFYTGMAKSITTKERGFLRPLIMS